MPKRKKKQQPPKKTPPPADPKQAAEALLRYRSQPDMRSKRFINSPP